MQPVADTSWLAPASAAADTARRVRWVFCALAAAIAAIALMMQGPSVLQDPDNWWHVKVGLDFLSSGTFPTVDTYSYTFAGHPWIAKDWFGEVLLALAYLAGGWNGVALLTIAAVALTIFLSMHFLSAELRPTLALGLVAVMAVLASATFNARPYILTFPIIICWTALLFRAAQKEEPPSLWLLPLIWLWANLHGTFTLGFVIAAFAGLHLLERIRFTNRVLLAKWIGFGILCLLVTLLNPYGAQAILATFTVASGNEAVPHIGEWRPFDAGKDIHHEAVLLLAIFGLLVSRLRIGWAKAAFLVLTLHLFLTHTRFVYLPVLLVPLVVAPDVAEQFPSISARAWARQARDRIEEFLARHFLKTAGGILAATALAVLLFGSASIAPSEETSAEGALAFAAESNLSGNVLNSYDLGGSLIFHGVRTYIDGRTDQLFLDGFLQKDMRAGGSAGMPILREILEEHEVEWALLVKDDARIPFFDQMADWRRAYADEHAVVYLRAD